MSLILVLLGMYDVSIPQILGNLCICLMNRELAFFHLFFASYWFPATRGINRRGFLLKHLQIMPE